MRSDVALKHLVNQIGDNDGVDSLLYQYVEGADFIFV